MAFNLPTGNAICYSGYRTGQSPASRLYPSLAEVREDLHLLAPHWPLLRLYDCTTHAERVLQVIREDGLPMRVLLGAWLDAEMDNPACPWSGVHGPALLEANRRTNDEEIERLVSLACTYEDIVFSVAVGNEATVDWTDHRVPVPRMIELVRRVRSRVSQPVTVCENHVPWRHELGSLAEELDFISLHTYALWEHKTLDEAMAHTQADVAAVAARYPGKPVAITEAGWCTASNGRGMNPSQATPEGQARYLRELIDWARSERVLCFVFEAFDEAWKGSPDPLEPEKHWGLFTADRQPKLAVHHLHPAAPPVPAAHA